jgi:hypothetical protein
MKGGLYANFSLYYVLTKILTYKYLICILLLKFKKSKSLLNRSSGTEALSETVLTFVRLLLTVTYNRR